MFLRFSSLGKRIICSSTLIGMAGLEPVHKPSAATHAARSSIELHSVSFRINIGITFHIALRVKKVFRLSVVAP